MESLKDAYYNPKTGRRSAYKLYVKLKKKIPLSTIKAFLKHQEVYQQMTGRKRKINYRPVQVYSSDDEWQADLIDLSKFSQWNKGMKYLLCVIDDFSRKAWVVPMKQKSDSIAAVKAVLQKEKPILIQTGNGTEFVNSNFQKLLKDSKVQYATVQAGDHNRQSIVERFNRTIE